MTDEHLDSMLDGHAWPEMPEGVSARLRARIARERARTPRRWFALAAMLLLGLGVGVVGGLAVGRAETPSGLDPSLIAHPEAPARTKRLFFDTPVFASRTHTRESVSTDWGTLRTSQGVEP